MNRVYVALDLASLVEAKRLAGSLVGEVAGFKVGLELIASEGPRAISEIADLGLPVFADMKLHDIPNTVEAAATHVRKAGARWLTVHASGGGPMLEAAVTGMSGQGVLGVTVLTSLDGGDLAAIGVESSTTTQVIRLARLAIAAGAEGLVSAPTEARPLRDAGIPATLFTPGVRPAATTADDQKRVATPSAALAAGSDYLVIGRPITGASDPAMAAREIALSLDG